MKKTLMLSLVALLTLGVAGFGWAAQSSEQDSLVEVEVPEPPAVPEAPDVEALFQEPVEAGACCMADCLEQRTACNSACGPDEACRNQCYDEYLACKSHC